LAGGILVGRVRLARGCPGLRGLASAAGRALLAHAALLQVGALRPRPPAALDAGPCHAPWRRRPPDASLSRAGRRAGDRRRLRVRRAACRAPAGAGGAEQTSRRAARALGRPRATGAGAGEKNTQAPVSPASSAASATGASDW